MKVTTPKIVALALAIGLMIANKICVGYNGQTGTYRAVYNRLCSSQLFDIMDSHRYLFLIAVIVWFFL